MSTPTYPCLNDEFEKCVKRSEGGRSIDCKLGLWGITSYSPESAEREARHYWIQYYQDGEYDQLLKSDQ